MQPPRGAERSRATPLHRAPAGLKLAIALALVLGTALMPRRPDLLYFVPAAVVLVLYAASRISLRFALHRLLIAQFFILGIGWLTLLAPEAAPVFLSAMIKSNLCVAIMLVLIWTTPFQDILQELRRWHVPSVMLTTLALMYRYLPVLIEESGRMQRARASRTFIKRRRLAWSNLAAIIGHLFIRSTERAERIYLAMCARGWK